MLRTEKPQKCLQSLTVKKGISLIERVKQGQGRPAIIYLKKFYDLEDKDTTSQSSTSKNENQAFSRIEKQTFENRKTDFRKSKVKDSGIEKQDFRKSKVRTFGNRSLEFRKSKCNLIILIILILIISIPINQDSYNIQNSDQTEERWIDRYTKTVDGNKKAN